MTVIVFADKSQVGAVVGRTVVAVVRTCGGRSSTVRWDAEVALKINQRRLA